MRQLKLCDLILGNQVDEYQQSVESKTSTIWLSDETRDSYSDIVKDDKLFQVQLNYFTIESDCESDGNSALQRLQQCRIASQAQDVMPTSSLEEVNFSPKYQVTHADNLLKYTTKTNSFDPCLSQNSLNLTNDSLCQVETLLDFVYESSAILCKKLEAEQRAVEFLSSRVTALSLQAVMTGRSIMELDSSISSAKNSLRQNEELESGRQFAIGV